jgi:CHAT domain-containing protein
MRYFIHSFLLLFFGFPLAVRSQPSRFNSDQIFQDYPSQDRANPTPSQGTRPASGGINPLLILNLINSLTRTGDSESKVVLSPDIAEIRGRISRLYLLLARQYILQKQLPAACNALNQAYVAELEAYLQKRLRSLQSESADCYVNELQKLSQLSGSPTALIYVTSSQDGLDLIFVPPAGAQSKTKEANPQPSHRFINKGNTTAIDRTIQEFRNNLRDPNSNDFLTQAKQLYDWIVRPMEAELQRSQIKTLIFVMNGNLRIVPPSALHDGKQYLVEKYAIASITSLQLTDLQRQGTNRNLQVLAMGLSESMQGWQPLPATKIEVEAISSQVLSGISFLNANFTIDKLQSQANEKKYGIIHLATHAKFVARSPNESYVQFWRDRLSMNRLADLKISTDILTLSACETALGEFLGLAGIAVSAGAQTVLASLWNVSDVGTAPLMISFYSQLRQAPSKAIALQQAQISLLRGEIKIEKGNLIGIKGVAAVPFFNNVNSLDLKHPYFWSAFTLIGNWL